MATYSNINIGNVVGGSSALPGGVNSTYFYARFVGYLIPSVTGLHTIGVNSKDGANLYIGDHALFENIDATQSANGSLAYTQSGTILLTAGVYYPITVEWQHGTGASYELQLAWTVPNGSIALIPTGNLSTVNTSIDGNLSGSWWNGTSGLWYPSGNGIIDFASTTHPNKHLDNIPDGSTYARPLATRISSGKPLIDFSESIHVNKNIDNIADGSTYNRTTPNQVTGAGRAFTALDSNNQIASQLRAKPLFAIQTFSASNPLSQSGTSKTILIAASTINWGTNAVSYNSGSVTPLTYGLKYVYADDPTFAGGAVTYVQTNNQLVVYQNDGRVFFGSITTDIGGGGSGGGGTCFSPNTKVKTRRGDVSFWDIREDDFTLTARGTWRRIALVKCSQFSGDLLDMGNDERVTKGHLFKAESAWVRAEELGIFPNVVHYEGLIANLCIEAEADDDGSAPDTEHSYTLANGRVVHNMPQGTN